MPIGALLGMIPQAIGSILGIGMQEANDRRQIRQQEKLQALQIAGQKDLTDYSYNKQLQMWKDTNYGAQVEQMKAAGINPALLYGMSGGGGSTTGTAGSTGVQGGAAPTGGREIMDGMGIAMQKAQMDLIKAQTKKTEVEANKTAGVDTQEAGGRISLMNAEFSQKLAQTEALRLQNAINQINLAWQQDTKDQGRNPILYAALRAMNEADIAGNNAEIGDETIEDQKSRIKAEAIGATLANMAVRQGIKESEGRVKLNAQQIEGIKSQIKTNSEMTLNWMRQNAQGWANMETQNKEMALRQLMQQFGIAADQEKAAMQAITQLLAAGAYQSGGKPTYNTNNYIIPNQ